jgi:hypothetical protein
MAVFDASDAGFWVDPRAHAPHDSPTIRQVADRAENAPRCEIEQFAT